MAGRPRSFDKDAALDTFVDVFWSRGFQDTSIDNLQAVTGIKRGSFYAAFGDKENAFVAALSRYADKVTTKSMTGVIERAATPFEGLIDLLEFLGGVMADAPGRGCLLCTTMADPPQLSDKVADSFEHALQTSQRIIFSTAEAAEHAGQLPAGQTAISITAYINSVMLGMNAMARSNTNPDCIRSAGITAAALLRQKAAH